MLKKENIPLVLEHSVLLDLRRILFKNGLNPQKFMSFLVMKTIINDERLVELIEEAKQENFLYSESNKNIKTLNAEELYSLIESEDNK